MAKAEPLTIPSNSVLYDPDALAELLAEDPDPRRAFTRFPRRLDRQVKRANAYRVPDQKDPVELLLDASAEQQSALELADQEPARLLRVPSGRLFAVPPDSTGEPAPPSPLVEIPPRLYLVRACRDRNEGSAAVELASTAEEGLSPEDRAILESARGSGRLNLLAILPPTLVVLGAGAFLLFQVDWHHDVTAWTLLDLATYWLLLFWLAKFVIRKLHPGLRGARQRLAEELERRKEALEENWEDQPAAVLLERIADDPGDPAVKEWPKELR